MVTPTSLNIGRYSFFVNSISPGSTSSLSRADSNDHISEIAKNGSPPGAIECWNQSGVYLSYEEIAHDSNRLAEFLNELLEDRHMSVEAALANFRGDVYGTQVSLIIHEIDTVVIDFLAKISMKFPRLSRIEIRCTEPAVTDVLALLLALPRIEKVQLSNVSQDVHDHFLQSASIQSNPKVQIDVPSDDIFAMD